jgi:hypothetical protein
MSYEERYTKDGVTLNDEVRDWNARGESLEEVARLTDLTLEQVREILAEHGELEEEE